MNAIRSAGLAAVLLAAGCTGSMEQENVAAEPSPPPAEKAVRGVRVLTQSAVWPGATVIKGEVTPVRVRIENNGRIPIDVRYRDLTLLAPDGARYNALPPYHIDPDIAQPTVNLEFGPVLQPRFTYSGFEIAPYYSPAYPELKVYRDVFVFDPQYYDREYRYWEDTDLPTFEMLQLALPEGVVMSGGNVEGWVYFRKVPDEVERVVFRGDLVNARTGQEFAQVRMPFDVN